MEVFGYRTQRVMKLTRLSHIAHTRPFEEEAMTLQEQYQECAEDYDVRALREADPALRAEYLRMARAYRRLATQAERADLPYESLPNVAEPVQLQQVEQGQQSEDLSEDLAAS
jgi:hypothetical protein